MKKGYFDWLENMETYEAIMYLSAFHNPVVIDLRA